MAKVTLNALVKAIHGKVGNAVFRGSPGGEISLIKRADMSRVKWSKAQREHRQRFKAANEYAKDALADPRRRAYYEERAALLKKTPHQLAVSDYFKDINLIEK